MNTTGITRKVDELGRIVLPIELRRVMDLIEGEAVEVFVDDDDKQIMLRKYRTQECIYCQSVEDLTYFRERFVCSSCLKEFKTLYESGLLVSPRESATLESKHYILPKGQANLRKRMKREETWELLVNVMNSYPEASQAQWARLIGIQQSRVSQLIRLMKKEGRLIK
ncbi:MULTISPECIES: AbrB/MazE/SpoVT family DNA-binding domain-containing protein [Paenibacillus]|uniref:AbrB/MazE/SpoVT family DNA-binding domain-containing protein n=1 Tax=Paenibacillus TaxID=44249 RepID=UPI000A07940C|nr:AbrB/MazE/SpoVT family DNA-binding domain-containing protein [Paenibacillus rhizosphaerae]